MTDLTKKLERLEEIRLRHRDLLSTLHEVTGPMTDFQASVIGLLSILIELQLDQTELAVRREMREGGYPAVIDLSKLSDTPPCGDFVAHDQRICSCFTSIVRPPAEPNGLKKGTNGLKTDTSVPESVSPNDDMADSAAKECEHEWGPEYYAGNGFMTKHCIRPSCLEVKSQLKPTPRRPSDG